MNFAIRLYLLQFFWGGLNYAKPTGHRSVRIPDENKTTFPIKPGQPIAVAQAIVNGRKNRALQLPTVVPDKALENFTKALYGRTWGTYSARFFRPGVVLSFSEFPNKGKEPVCQSESVGIFPPK